MEAKNQVVKGVVNLNTKSWQERLHSGRCGAGSLKIVAGYYGVSKSEALLARLCGTDRQFGTSAKRLSNAARDIGLSAHTVSRANFTDMEHWLRKGVPIIVNWFSPGRRDYEDGEMPDGHYSVVSGISPNFIILEDPEIGRKRCIKRADFLRVWFDFKGSEIKRCE